MFYPSGRESLLREIESCFLHRLGPGRLPRRVKGDRRPGALISPHAGYTYSGPIAAHAYAQLDGCNVNVAIVLGPNHYGVGTPVSIFPEGVWATPLGEISIDTELAMELSNLSDVFSLDEVSHEHEHSIEVQLPFLQYVVGSFRLVPICMLDQSVEAALRVGEALAEILRGRGDVALIASSDMTHYEPHERASRKDSIALERIGRLDIEGLYEAILEHDISMCGYGPVAAVLHACRRVGADQAEVLKYATSGDVSGDYSSVVGYAAVEVKLPAHRLTPSPE
jgi:AmmeMemoRadiSam system protein B